MSRASRDKGARGEREVVAILRRHGFDAQRTPNSGGLHVKADVIGVSGVHFEVKRQETARPWAWMAQAIADSCTDDAAEQVVAFRRSCSPWYAMVELEALVRLLAIAEAQEEYDAVGAARILRYRAAVERLTADGMTAQTDA